MRWRPGRPLWVPLFGVFVAAGAGLLFCAALSLWAGHGPLDLLAAIWQGAWGSTDSAATSLAKVSPLLLTGLAVALAYQVGLLNIGCEGQMMLGALASAGFAIFADFLPTLFLLPLTILIGVVVGGLWAYPAVWLRQKRGVHEVISTLLMNYLAIHTADYLARGPLGDGSGMARTAVIPDGATWSTWWTSGTIGVTMAPFLAILLCFVAQIWLSRTVGGYEATAVGNNPLAAETAGISPWVWKRRLFVLSGALAGLAGALEVVAVHHRFYAAFSPGYGFDGITVAFLAQACPGWLWLSGLLLASLRATDKWLQLILGISPNIIFVIEGVLLLAVAGQTGLKMYWQRLASRFAGPRETAVP